MATDFIIPLVNWTAVDYLHLDWGDKVMRNTDKSIKDPMEKAKNLYVFNFNIGYGSVALPLNLYVVLVILSDSKLRNDPKYVMKVKTALCSLFIVLTDAEEAAYFFWRSEELCHSLIFTIGSHLTKHK